MRSELSGSLKNFNPEPPDKSQPPGNKRGNKPAPVKPKRNPSDDFVGPLKNLPEHEIPTLIETFGACLNYRENITFQENRSYSKVSDSECIYYIVNQLMDNIIHFGLQPLAKLTIVNKLKKCFKIRNVYLLHKRTGRLDSFPPKSISESYKWYRENSFNMLNCVDENKVPKIEQTFYEDQKKGYDPNRDKLLNRKMKCGNLDKKESKILQLRAERNAKIQQQEGALLINTKEKKNPKPNSLELPTKLRPNRGNSSVDMEISVTETNSDPDYEPTQWRVKNEFKKKKIN